jgi:ATP-dependent helicase HrpB
MGQLGSGAVRQLGSGAVREWCVVRLPIDDFLPTIVASVRARRAAVIVAAPGAGKTTRVPPALCDDGPVLVLQPRRVAARSMAARVASERGWTLGREVGWHVRLDRHFTRDTRVLFATEGMLTARLLQDPLLSDFRTVIIDEFHERSVHADLGIALARQAWAARDDLRIVVMSATIDAARVAEFLGGAPIVDVPGRTFPLEIHHAPGVTVEQAVLDVVPSLRGAALCFLPGAGEITRAANGLAARLSVSAPDVSVLPLHGGLSADAQDAAIRSTTGRRVILATNLAETTLTVPDVTVVIDAGLQKVARYDAERAIDRLVTERVPQDSADQRAGRAGRVQAGRVWRLWDARDRLRSHREAEIHRIDLAATVLDVVAWGGDPFTPGGFGWFEAPPVHALDAARALLHQLGAIDANGRLTTLGGDVRRIPAHPRLARLLLADGASERAARAVAMISEGGRAVRTARDQAVPVAASVVRGGDVAECDVLALVEDREFPHHLKELARALRASTSGAGGLDAGTASEARFRRALFAAYPDRLARRRTPQSDRFVLASGTGARLSRESGVHHAEFVVAVEIRRVEGIAGAGGRSSGGRGPGASSAADEAMIVMASRVEPEWIVPTSREVVHEFDAAAGKVRAARIERYGALVLSSHAVAVDATAAAPIYARIWRARERTPREQELLARLKFAAGGTGAKGARGSEPFSTVLAQLGTEVSDETSVPDWAFSVENGSDPLAPLASLPPDIVRRLEQAAPSTLRVPSGRDRPLSYRDDGSVVASVKLQEVFGLADSPRIGAQQVPVTFELLAPNGRPVQVTRDLKSFWTRGYLDVRKELRGRYPKHPWPDDPWTATPTARAKRRDAR